ncbi:MAG TPA: hypothetical protein CFH81_01015 [Sulfurovum sp. UBA12169]|nr:MAG TPA: hypothetical protein CFH81_01015 [Sulfurovum sp. UBA12169]
MQKNVQKKMPDQWEIALTVKQEELQACQVSRELNSCLKCELVLKCELRDAYVISVYESMNKGESGGFEF